MNITRPPIRMSVEELANVIDSLVASSVEAHRILGTPEGSAVTLAQSATRVMKDLDDLRHQVRQLRERLGPVCR